MNKYIYVLIIITVVYGIGNFAEAEVFECFTDTCVKCIDDCLDPVKEE